MGFLKRKKKEYHGPSLEAEARSARVAISPPQDRSPAQSTQDSLPGNRESPNVRQTPSAEPSGEPSSDSEHPENVPATDDLLDPNLIGRTIKLVRAEGWEEDIIPTVSKETYILYENQRGMFFFGKPYFSSNSLIQTLKFDPPASQRTNTFLTHHPGKVDPSDPQNKHWPPDPEKLYYSPYTPNGGILSMDSETGKAWKWKQDRWYVDMRGDVDEEGWEYAFYWNGRYRWCGGNWHGKSVLIHGWVRRRRWVRDMERRKVREDRKEKETTSEHDGVGKLGGGGFDGLLVHLRKFQSPNTRRKELHDFFDACLPETMKQLAVYIHHIYILLDPISTAELIRLLEERFDVDGNDSDLQDALSASLNYLYSKRDSLTNREGTLPNLKSLPETKWSTYSPPDKTSSHPSRRLRLRVLRAQWHKSHQTPARLFRKVRFSDIGSPETEEEYVIAPETMSRGELGRSLSSESRDEWFVAPEEQGGKVEKTKSVAALLRECNIEEEAVEDV